MANADAGTLDRRILIERPVRVSDEYGSGTVTTWQTVATVWASVLDYLLFNSGEGVVGELRQRVLPTRVRIRYRTDITTDMRITILDRSRMLQIVSISEIGRGDLLEMMAENYSTAGVS
jgi:SPP1 family predicted phage head-tail adaptor